MDGVATKERMERDEALTAAENLANTYLDESLREAGIRIEIRMVKGTYRVCAVNGTEEQRREALQQVLDGMKEGYTGNLLAYVILGGAFKEGGLSEDELNEVRSLNKSDQEYLAGKIAGALENAELKFSLPEEVKEGGRGKGEAITYGYVITQEQWDKWMEEIRNRQFHVTEEESKKEVRKVKKEARVKAEERKEGVVVYIGTTGKRKGKGEVKGTFRVYMNGKSIEKVYEGFYNWLLKQDGKYGITVKDGVVKWTHKGKEYVLAKDGEVNLKNLKEFMYVNRNNREAMNAYVDVCKSAMGEDLWEETLKNAQAAYAQDYKGKRMSVRGFAAGLIYGVCEYSMVE